MQIRKRERWIFFGMLIFCIGLFSYKIQDKYFKMAKSLDQMAAVYQDLNTYYVDSLDPAKLMETGIKAMTQSLDPYTVFYPEEDIEQLDFQKTGEYAGIGASFRMINDTVVISSLFSEGPFAQAGFHPGDVILSLNDESLIGKNPKEVHDLLRGKSGSVLKVAVKNPWSGETTTKKIQRATIKVPSVSYKKVLPHHIGYIKFRQFTNGSARHFKAAFESLKKEDVALSGLVIDLRNNPGGLLEEAVLMSNYFLPKGDTIVSVRGRDKKWNRAYTATRTPIDTQIPLAVLVNGKSASAAEIFSGAMQDLDRAVIVGSPSFGKGLVQGTRKIPYNGQLKLTVGRYYTPSGRCIQAIDYEHRDLLGNPVYIPDSLKVDFQTSDGRVVTDKGGITPDKEVEKYSMSNLANALMNKNLFFRFASHYRYLHPDFPPLDSFYISDSLFALFNDFVGLHALDYQSRGERALDQFRADAISGNYFDSVSATYHELLEKVKKQAHPSLAKNQKEIKALLAKEIMHCYYRLSGRTAAGLPSDPAIQHAAKLLVSSGKYQALLK